MLVEPRGPEKFRRYVLTLQGRVWEGKQWAKKARKPILFHSTGAAHDEEMRLLPEVNKNSTVSLFSFPIHLHIVSAFPFDLDEMRKFLERKINYTFGGMDGAPEGASCSFIQMGQCSIKQRGPLPAPGTTRSMMVEVPLRIRLLAKGEVEVDLPRLGEWLKRHIHIEADELTFGPVTIAQVGAAWRKAKVTDAK